MAEDGEGQADHHKDVDECVVLVRNGFEDHSSENDEKGGEDLEDEELPQRVALLQPNSEVCDLVEDLLGEEREGEDDAGPLVFLTN